MQTLEMAESLSSISFRDETFLMREPLSPSNILEYFYASQFYSLTGGAKSINEMIRRGSIAPEAAGRIDGELYMLVSANKDAEAGMTGMSVFVIQKFRQIVNKPRVPLEIFYVISGTIYLAPGLGKLLERHLETGIEQFEVMMDSIRSAVRKDTFMDHTS